jgi:hypothetical protein
MHTYVNLVPLLIITSSVVSFDIRFLITKISKLNFPCMGACKLFIPPPVSIQLLSSCQVASIWKTPTLYYLLSYRECPGPCSASVCVRGRCPCVHGGRRCRACQLCVCAQCVCVCVRAQPSAESKGSINSFSSPPPLRADSVTAGTYTKCSESRAHA